MRFLNIFSLLWVIAVFSQETLAQVSEKVDSTVQKNKLSKSAADILAQSPDSDWHSLDENQTIYFFFEKPDKTEAKVIMQLSPQTTPLHFKNISTLINEKYFDGLTIYRVADNWVVQWGDPNGDDPALKKPLGSALETLPGEFDISSSELQAPFIKIPSADTFAEEVGFIADFPAGRSIKEGKTWLLHCYGSLGVARATEPTSGAGDSLYSVIGSARRLDRNYSVVGKVLYGIEGLSSLPRGSADSGGFYDDPKQYLKITRVAFLKNISASERVDIKILRSESETFSKWIQAKKDMIGFPYNWGTLDICGISLPMRFPPK